MTFVLKMIYVANLESLHYSANSDLVELGEPREGEEDEELEEPAEEDADELPPDDEELSEEEPGGGPGGGESETGVAEAGGAPARGTGESPAVGPVPLTTAAGASRAQGEARDPADPDADGVAGGADNCPGLYNPDQADRDGDRQGDACDADADGDGVYDDVDCAPADPGAGRPASRVEPHLRLHRRPDEVLVW